MASLVSIHSGRRGETLQPIFTRISDSEQADGHHIDHDNACLDDDDFLGKNDFRVHERML